MKLKSNQELNEAVVLRSSTALTLDAATLGMWRQFHNNIVQQPQASLRSALLSE